MHFFIFFGHDSSYSSKDDQIMEMTVIIVHGVLWFSWAHLLIQVSELLWWTDCKNLSDSKNLLHVVTTNEPFILY